MGPVSAETPRLTPRIGRCPQYAQVLLYVVTALLLTSTVQSAASQAKKPAWASALKPSVAKCSGDTPQRSACVFDELLLHKGRLYYLLGDNGKDAALSLPEAKSPGKAADGSQLRYGWQAIKGGGIPVSEWDSQLSGGPDLVYRTLDDIIRPVTLKELVDAVHSALQDDGIDEEFLKVEVKKLDTALVARVPHDPMNYWHAMDDAMTWALRWCWFLGACEYDKARAENSALFMVADPGLALGSFDAYRESGRPAIAEMLQCWMGMMQPALEHEDYADTSPYPDTLFVAKKAAAGAGNATAHPFHFQTQHQDEVGHEGRTHILRYMRGCAGLTPDPRPPPADGKLTITLVNRKYDAGRGMLRLDELWWRVSREMPNATVRIAFMDGLTWAEQVSVFDESDIVTIPHGAAVMNLWFVPQVAVIVDCNSISDAGIHQTAIVSHMPPQYKVENIQLIHTERSHTAPILSRVAADWGYQNQNSANAQLDFVMGTDDWGGYHNRGTNHHTLNLLFDVDELVDSVKLAVERWHDLQAKRDQSDTRCRTWCNGHCTDTEVDDNNCGVCGYQCSVDSPCTYGHCCQKFMRLDFCAAKHSIAFGALEHHRSSHSGGDL